jgi:hypothetical protein
MTSLDEDLQPYRRSALWANVKPEQWNDWRWQMGHRVTTLEQLRQIIHLTPDEEQAVQLKPELKMADDGHRFLGGTSVDGRDGAETERNQSDELHDDDAD